MARKYTDEILVIGLSNVDEIRVNPLSWDNNISYLNQEICKFDTALENTIIYCVYLRVNVY